MKKCFEFPNKNRYNTQKDAETAILVSNMAGRPEMCFYHCDSCDGWHLSKKK